MNYLLRAFGAAALIAAGVVGDRVLSPVPNSSPVSPANAATQTNAAAAKAALGKYTQTDDPAVLDESYRYYRDLWGRPDFRVSPEAVRAMLAVIDAPGASAARGEDFVDNHFVDELHASGFVRESGALD